MPSLITSRALESRLQAGMRLDGAFQLETVTRLSQAIADLGCVLETMRQPEQIAVLQDQLASMHNHLCELMNAATVRLEVVRASR